MDGDAGTRKPATIIILMTVLLGWASLLNTHCTTYSIVSGRKNEWQRTGSNFQRKFYECRRSSAHRVAEALGVSESQFSYAHIG